MKIVFLCGSLEPGRDGVGDYTRRLAIEMIKQGHNVAAIALNDWHLSSEFLGTQNAENNNLEILRLPSVWPANKRFARAKEWINLLDPEWLSLQFVNFAFNLRGLHFGLGNKLSVLGRGRKWHIMFHELWVGMAVDAKTKHILWGKVQRKLIKSLIYKLKPRIIHTQSHLYLAQLKRLGVNAEFLPLFSNIPRIHIPLNINVNSHGDIAGKKFSFVVFGTIHPMSPVDEFAKEVKTFATEKDLEVTFIFVGRNGSELERWTKVLEAEQLNFKLLGEQSVTEISNILSHASVGISTSSIAYIEKSGTVVAMREHGLPVICVASSSRLIDMQYVAPPYGILEYKLGNLEHCLNMQFELTGIDTISEVSSSMEEAFLTND